MSYNFSSKTFLPHSATASYISWLTCSNVIIMPLLCKHIGCWKIDMLLSKLPNTTLDSLPIFLGIQIWMLSTCWTVWVPCPGVCYHISMSITHTTSHLHLNWYRTLGRQSPPILCIGYRPNPSLFAVLELESRDVVQFPRAKPEAIYATLEGF